ncbi:MAG: hypothetical protein JJU15_08575 [Pararhodobacter sp.]|nr:hypothetical protein [Pararhodobacter sp.]
MPATSHTAAPSRSSRRNVTALAIPAQVIPALGMALSLALAACSPATDDLTPRLLSPQELHSATESARTAAPAPAGALESRAAALRARAAAQRSQTGAAPENDDLRRRAQRLAPAQQ